MNKLLLIVGTTATGKTSLGIKLAKKFSAEILAADSRQVYKYMDIGTGKDLPRGSEIQKSDLISLGKYLGYYFIEGIKLWGYDVVDPDEEFSVAHFVKIARTVIRDIWRRQKLPIVVGGTGLYTKALTEPIETIHIPPDEKLRKKLGKQSLKRLQATLKKLNPDRFRVMNRSDRRNTRRLIRAIEVGLHRQNQSPFKEAIVKAGDAVLWIGLKAPREVLYKRIDLRVDQRVRQGAEEEIKALIKSGFTFSLPAMSALGYRQWKPYLDKQATRDEVIASWKLEEHAYARRQLTWFAKNKKIHWYDITKPKLVAKVEHQVDQWYSGAQ